MPKKPATPAPKLPVLNQERLRSIADFVLRESAAGEVRSIINIGRFLFSQVFNASEEAFRSKDPTKPDSLRDLADQEGMAEAEWGKDRLGRAIESAEAKPIAAIRASTIQKRVRQHYDKADLDRTYRALYDELIAAPDAVEASEVVAWPA